MATFVCPVTTCNTCKASFDDVELLRNHYRGDWHVLNSKRRANSLAPVTLGDYKKLASNIKKSKPDSTTVPKKNLVKNMESSVSTEHGDILESKNDNQKNNDFNKSQTNEQNTTDQSSSVPNELTEDNISRLSDNIPSPSIGSNVCLFDDNEFSSTLECVDYMKITYGFFIPDKEYLTDLDGMITYLNEKIKLGGICLYCQKQFAPGRPCQNHMINKSHCKISYESDIDFEEFEDFYDFSTSNNGENTERRNKKNQINDDEEEESDDDEYTDSDEDDENSVERTLEISPTTGELILLDGRTAGHRDFRRYYKQHFKPEDLRPSVLAQKREVLLKIGASLGLNDFTGSDVQQFSDAQVLHLLMKQNRQVRRAQMIEQRARQKYELTVKRREYKSAVAKLRSSETTTAKIRDYHSRLL